MLKSNSKIRFIKPGLLTSVQDHGRFGYADFGVPYSGAMDQFSYSLANLLLDNGEEAAVLEMALLGPEMVFEMAATVVFTGALAEIFLNEIPQPIGKLLYLQPNDRVRIGHFIKGQWLYMGVKGGILSPIILESRSWFEGISDQKVASKDTIIHYTTDPDAAIPQNSHPKLTHAWFETNKIDVYPGPDWDILPEAIKQQLHEHKFTIGKLTSRMGIQLKSNLIHQIPDILTAPVYPGTIQLTPSGNLIVLMRDAQVTGGYPRILQVTDHSLNIIAQKTTSELVSFRILNY
ncbi:biotin-dependent carboxyltransferase family protein [Belliella kenyensis]|uniref:Biotin-dependent carboxyltransferase family protein n=1 Tax=Belliella kenyensis TaxID=1472724 RepID=A0ABV8ELQ8_9BACT|nr:biotin-dependent carboxyltransferase family protein [Belliella kenyensis]MCH7400379.1 biotin-dependent carboxyltransferase family protein [Belliella kenyensis]MDN3604603.1 biotin-dependent carboxyltransferase family protein [Belliella kenyensis]